MWLSTPRLTSWTELLQREQEELLTQSQELQAPLENVQQELRHWQASYHNLKTEQLSKEISLTKLSIQCEARPGAGGPEPWADSLGLSQVRTGPHWRLCPKTVWQCRPEAEGKPEAFHGDKHLGWWECQKRPLTNLCFLYF